MDILEQFHKKEENVPRSFWLIFKKRRKLSHGHYDKFLQKGGKCPRVILTRFHKKEENVPLSFWQDLKKEENVPLSFWQVFTKRRKMSHSDSDKFSQKGGKSPTVILTSFHKKEENVPWTFLKNFTKRRKMSLGHSD